MNVGVDQAGQEGATGEVEALARTGRRGEQAALDGLDALAGDAHHRAEDGGGAGAVEESIRGDKEGFHARAQHFSPPPARRKSSLLFPALERQAAFPTGNANWHRWALPLQ